MLGGLHAIGMGLNLDVAFDAFNANEDYLVGLSLFAVGVLSISLSYTIIKFLQFKLGKKSKKMNYLEIELIIDKLNLANKGIEPTLL